MNIIFHGGPVSYGSRSCFSIGKRDSTFIEVVACTTTNCSNISQVFDYCYSGLKGMYFYYLHGVFYLGAVEYFTKYRRYRKCVLKEVGAKENVIWYKSFFSLLHIVLYS